MSQTRFACAVLLVTLLLASVSTASAQTAYLWAKYTLSGYGVLDMGYTCDLGQLRVAVHGEAKGSLSVALGNDAPRSATFDGNNGMGPDGYYTQALVEKSVQCDERGSWPPLSISASGGPTLTIHW
jgi:hypothetical protein